MIPVISHGTSSLYLNRLRATALRRKPEGSVAVTAKYWKGMKGFNAISLDRRESNPTVGA
jgi:hypothetical protein